MPKTIIESLQQEMDELGIEPATLENDNTLEASLEDDDNLSQDSELDNTDKAEESAEEETPAKVQKDLIKDKVKERAERRGNRIRNLEETVNNLAKSVQAFLDKGKTEEAQDEIADYSAKHNLDAEGIKELVSIIEKRVGKTDAPVETEPEYNESEQKEIFNADWDELLPKIEEQYPHASASQIREAQKLMDEVSHSSPQLASYDLEDIFNSPKYSQKFKDILFSNKKRTFESGRTVERGKLEEDIDFENIDISTPEKALKAKAALYKATGGQTTEMFDASGGRVLSI